MIKPDTAKHVLYLALAVFVFQIIRRFIELSNLGGMGLMMAQQDNDSFLRLVSIREWMAGAGWFELTIERFRPPEGLDLHWSRYIDAGIVALMSVLGVFVSPVTAEALAIVLWPTLLLVLYCVIAGRFVYRLSGPFAAAFLLLAALGTIGLGQLYFKSTALDHHNVQILLCMVMAVCLIQTNRPAFFGILCGACAAFSLALGLELLVIVALIGTIAVVEAVMQRAGACRKLAGFGGAFGMLSLILFLGQTPPDLWTVARCDVVSPPYLLLTSIAGLLALAAAYTFPKCARLSHRLIAVSGFALLAVAAAMPLLIICPAGPYAELSAELVEAINTRVVETQSGLTAVLNGNGLAFGFAMPAAFAYLGALILWAREYAKSERTELYRALSILLLLAAFGVVGAFVQLRFSVTSWGIVPLLMALVVGELFKMAEQAQEARGQQRALVLVLVSGALFVLSPAAFRAASGAAQAPSLSVEAEAPLAPIDMLACHDLETWNHLNSLEPAGIFASGVQSMRLLLLTDHSVFVGPYHRSPQAFLDVFVIVDGDEAPFKASVLRSGAAFVLLCGDDIYADDSFLGKVRDGQESAWLEPVPLPENNPMTLLRVVR